MDSRATTAPRSAASAPPSIAATVSVGIVALAVFLFVEAGRDQGLGPLDLETAGRLNQVLWTAAPIVGGLLARRADAGRLIRAGITLGLVVGLSLALFPTSGTGQYTCPLDLPAIPMGYPIGRLAIGGLVGAGLACGFVTAGLAGRRLLTMVPGIVLAVVVHFWASTAAFHLFYDGVRCLA